MRKRLLTILMMFAMVLSVLTITDVSAEAATKNSMNIYGIFLGNGTEQAGDATLIESNGKYLLIDMGTYESYPKLKKFLNDRGVTKLSLYFSHLHADHTGGLRDGQGYEALLRDFDVEKVYAPDESIIPDRQFFEDQTLAWNYSKIEELYAEVYPDRTDRIVYLKKGSTFSFGSVKAKVIGPVGMEKFYLSYYENLKSDNAINEYLNNLSLVTTFTCGTTKFLAAGDCGLEEEQYLIKKYGNDGTLKADILKLSHHGYASANSIDFMAYVQPKYSYACNSGVDGTGLTSGSTYHRKTYSSREAACKYGIVYMVGDEEKAVCYKVDENNKISMYTEADKFKTALKGWVKLVGADGVNQMYDFYYIDDNGNTLTGVQKIGGKTYYFGEGGCCVSGDYIYNTKTKTYTFSAGLTYNMSKDGKTYDVRYYKKPTAKAAGEMLVGWQEIEDSTYYFNPETGYRVSGEQKIEGKTYYFGNGGEFKTNQKVADDNGWKWFGEDGVLKTGFYERDGNYYYANSDGYVTVGDDNWPIKKIEGNYYAINGNGLISRGGFRKYVIKGENFYRYFDAKTGKMALGWFTDSETGYTYYFETTDKATLGFKYTGTREVNGTTYSFGNSGALQKGTFFTQDGKKQYFDSTGNVVKDQFITIKNEDGSTSLYYADKDGYIVLGDATWPIKKIGSSYYAVNAKGVIYRDGFRKYVVKEKNYYRYFDKETGKMTTGWYTDAETGNTYYFEATNKSTIGFRVTGVYTVDGKTYNFGNSGVLQKNTFATSNGKKQYFDENGNVAKNQFIKISATEMYYADKDGYIVVGTNKWPIKKISGKYYAINEKGRISLSGWKKYTVKNKSYYRYFDTKTGVMLTGFQKLNGNTYYLDAKTGYRQSGLVKVKNDYYFFSNAGIMAKNKGVSINGKRFVVGSDGKIVLNTPTTSTIKKVTPASGALTINYDKSTYADGYEIYVSTTSNGKYKLVATVEGAKTVTYKITGLNKKTAYYVKIRPYSKIANDTIYGEYSTVVTKKTK